MRTDKLQDNDRTYRARQTAVLVFLAAFLSLSFAVAAAPSERWYLLFLAGQPVGSVQESFWIGRWTRRELWRLEEMRGGMLAPW